MSASSQAVFLSYASQDAEAARRLCEALRAAGVEVWFDQSELVGGDAWDAKIRGQIKACALFIPVISANTQARREGYFRLEWRLAVERMQQMDDDLPFLLPVVIDATRDADAFVPDRFRTVQWTRLPGGETTPAFGERVKKLLGGGDTVGAALRRDAVEPSRREAAPTRRPARSWSLPAVIALAVIVALAIWQPWKPATTTDSAARRSAPPTSERATAKSPAGPRLGPKSIAVLPFENQSADKDADAFFADGIHEDLITTLLVVRELRCVPRATAIGYRDTKKSHREIAEELGVAHVLTGSVRRADKKVRITGTLLDARDDTPLWTKSYDKDLTDAGVIFAIQSELSRSIAEELKAALSPEETKLIAKPSTRNVAAYESVLKARSLANQPDGPAAHRGEIVSLLERAVQLDPGYGTAYADLVYAHVYLGRQADVAKAKEAIDAALRVDAESLDVVRAVGDYYYYGLGDFARALEHYARVIALRPNDALSLHRLGSVQRRQARWTDAVASFRQVKELDPTNLNSVGGLGLTLQSGRRYDEALVDFRYLAERRPDDLRFRLAVAIVPFLATGSTEEVEAVWRALSPDESNSPTGTDYRLAWALWRGEVDEALRLDRKLGDRTRGIRTTLDLAAAAMVRGEKDAAHAYVREREVSLRQTLEPTAARAREWAWQGSMLAILGRKEEALGCVRKAVELMPEAQDAIYAGVVRAELAFVYAWTGEKERAIAEYATMLRKPWAQMISPSTENNVHVMKRHPRYHPLRGDPRFEALLNDPRNNAPLF